MKTIPLSKGKYLSLVDDEDFDALVKFKWQAVRAGNKLYARRSVAGPNYGPNTNFLMHRQLMEFPASQVDHIDGDSLNNQRSNLRVATCTQNHVNRKKKPGAASVYRGVFRHGRRWRASVGINGRSVLLGSFKEECDAATAYNFGAYAQYGEYVRMNLPLERMLEK